MNIMDNKSFPGEFAKSLPVGMPVAVAAATLLARRIEFGGRDGTVGWQRDRSIVVSENGVEHPEVG